MDTKRCTRCLQVLPRTDFYFRKSGEILPKCKSCTKAMDREWKKANPEKTREQKRRHYEERAYQIHAEQIARARAANPEKYAEINRRWMEKNKERAYESNRAGRKVRAAIGNGSLVKSTVCEQCGRTNCRIEASHDDYSRPLDVIWLCVRCHRKKDYRHPNT